MEFWKEKQDAVNQWLYEDKYVSPQEFRARQLDSSRYRPELPKSNMGHRGEDSTTIFIRPKN
jgi:hypothetical protein